MAGKHKLCPNESRSSFVHPTVIFLNKGTARCHRSLPKIVLLHTYPFQRASQVTQVTQKRVTIRVTSGSVFSDATTTERSQSFWAFHFSIVRPFNGGQATVLMPERIDSSFWGRREKRERGRSVRSFGDRVTVFSQTKTLPYLALSRLTLFGIRNRSLQH